MSPDVILRLRKLYYKYLQEGTREREQQRLLKELLTDKVNKDKSGRPESRSLKKLNENFENLTKSYLKGYR
jgi:hypothetical protein